MNKIYLKQNTRVGIYVGPGVLGFTLLEEDRGNNVVKLRNKFEKFVVRKVLFMRLKKNNIKKRLKRQELVYNDYF